METAVRLWDMSVFDRNISYTLIHEMPLLTLNTFNNVRNRLESAVYLEKYW